MFHDNLITLRKMKNMTQEDIADIVGVSRQSVAKWETGETVPDLDKCKKLAEYLKCRLMIWLIMNRRIAWVCRFHQKENISSEW